MAVTSFGNSKSRMKLFGKTQTMRQWREMTRPTFSSLSIFNAIFHPAHLEILIPSPPGIMSSFGLSVLWRKSEDPSVDGLLPFTQNKHCS